MGRLDNAFVQLHIVNHNQLLQNNGNGTFREIADPSSNRRKPLAVLRHWDNNDGLLDLLVIIYLDYDLKTAAGCSTQNIALMLAK
jgi:hypothetical protein